MVLCGGLRVFRERMAQMVQLDPSVLLVLTELLGLRDLLVLMALAAVLAPMVPTGLMVFQLIRLQSRQDSSEMKQHGWPPL